MLISLRIQDIALVRSTFLQFGPGLSVLTGESGSGKSVVLDSLALVTGAVRPRVRARSGVSSGLVEAEFLPARKADGSFVSSELEAALFSHGLLAAASDPEEPLVLARRIEANGRTRCFVQGQTVSRLALAAIGHCLLELCGQSEAHTLRTPAAQLAALDHFGGLGALISEVEKLVKRLREDETEMAALFVKVTEAERQRDFLEFQLTELRACDTTDVVEKQKRLLELEQGTQEQEAHRQALDTLTEAEGAVLPQLRWLAARLSNKNAPGPLTEHVHTAIDSLETVCSAVAASLRESEKEDQERASLQEELGVLSTLARKHRVPPEGLDARRTELENLLQENARLESRLLEVQSSVEQVRALCQKKAEGLHQARKKAALHLGKRLKAELEEVGLPAAQFETHLSRGDLTSSGITHLDIGFSANPGHAPLPLSRVASGGELSRILLCFRLVQESSGALLTFDEIDAGAGGKTAEKIAQALLRASAQSQVLCVTHWPHVAGVAHRQFSVTKQTLKGETITAIQEVEGEARLSELSRMLGGTEATAREHASKLVATPIPVSRKAPRPAAA